MFSLFSKRPVAAHPAPPISASRGKPEKGEARPLPKPDWHQHRYPPAPVGVPLYDPDALLDLHPELIYGIRLSSGLDDKAFDAHYLQVARNYAHFVHVLPASRAHHHRNMGGMLRHGLEVASFAMRRSDMLILGGHESPRQRFQDEAIWRFAMFVAAIGHDIGKIVADIEVFDHSGNLRWNPFEETLVEWGVRNTLTTYHPQWSERRVHRAHEAMSAVLLNRLLDPLHFAYLATGAREILMHVATTVAGVAMQDNPLYAVVMAADHASVSASLGSDTRVVEGISVGISPAERFIEAAVRLLHDGWQVNQPGARVLVSKSACYLAWPQAFDDVKARLEREGVTGILTTPDQVAGLLIDTNFAVPKLRPNGGKTLYHRVAPDFKSVSVKLASNYLKLAGFTVLFASAPPKAIDLEEIEDIPRPEAPHQEPQAPESEAAPYPEGEIPFEEPPEAPPPATGAFPETPAPAPPPSVPSSTAPAVPASAATGPSGPKPAAPSQKPATKPSTASGEPPAAAGSGPTPQEHAREYLLRQRGAAGQALLSLVEAINNGDLVPGKALFAEKTDLLISAAAAAKAVALDLANLGEVLDSNGILIVDPKRPTTRMVRHVTNGGGALNCFRISARPSAAMRSLISRKVLEKLDGGTGATTSVPAPTSAPPAATPPAATPTESPTTAAANPKSGKARKPAQPKSPPPAAGSVPQSPPPAPAPPSDAPHVDAKDVRDRIYAALNALADTAPLPEGIVRVENDLVGHREALIGYLKQQIPEVSGKEIYAVAMTLLQFAPTPLLRAAGFSAGSKPYRFGLRP